MRALIDKVFSKSMMERFDLTLKESRRIAVELARRRVCVVGIDFSQKMINLANSLSKK